MHLALDLNGCNHFHRQKVESSNKATELSFEFMLFFPHTVPKVKSELWFTSIAITICANQKSGSKSKKLSKLLLAKRNSGLEMEFKLLNFNRHLKNYFRLIVQHLWTCPGLSTDVLLGWSLGWVI